MLRTPDQSAKPPDPCSLLLWGRMEPAMREFIKLFLAATAALEVQMLVCVCVCVCVTLATTVLNFCRTSAGLLQDFSRFFEGLQGLLKDF